MGKSWDNGYTSGKQTGVPDPVYPTYKVEQPEYEEEPVCLVSVNKQSNPTDQTEELLRKLVEALTPVEPITTPVKASDSITWNKLSELLMSKVVGSKPEVPKVVVPTGLEEMLRSYFMGLPSTGLGSRGSALAKGLVGYEMFFVWEVGS